MNTGISPAYPSTLMDKSWASVRHVDKSTWRNTVVSVVYLKGEEEQMGYCSDKSAKMAFTYSIPVAHLASNMTM